MNKFIVAGSLISTAFYATASIAHPGVHGDQGVVDGLYHQFTQADHLSTLLVTGLGLVVTGIVLLRQRKASKEKK